jgi:hypothetical protein
MRASSVTRVRSLASISLRIDSLSAAPPLNPRQALVNRTLAAVIPAFKPACAQAACKDV